MNTKTILQVPIDKDLKKQATLVANEMGFSSLQETIRLFINKLITREIGISFISSVPVVKLSKENAKRYDQMLNDIESGKVETIKTKNTKDLMKQLE